MAEVVIHRCTLRVVRRHGWSWGPAPDRLLKAAVAALPFLLARKLSDLFAEDTEREITERVSLNVAVTLSELLRSEERRVGKELTSIWVRNGRSSERKRI